MYGYVKVGSAVPKLRVADCVYNKEILKLSGGSRREESRCACCPSPSSPLQAIPVQLNNSTASARRRAGNSKEIAEATEALNIFLLIGAPITVDNQMFNCAVACHEASFWVSFPKTHIHNYGEFYEERWFAHRMTF